jgi:hypothetical protein
MNSDSIGIDRQGFKRPPNKEKGRNLRASSRGIGVSPGARSKLKKISKQDMILVLYELKFFRFVIM